MSCCYFSASFGNQQIQAPRAGREIHQAAVPPEGFPRGRARARCSGLLLRVHRPYLRKDVLDDRWSLGTLSPIWSKRLPLYRPRCGIVLGRAPPHQRQLSSGPPISGWPPSMGSLVGAVRLALLVLVGLGLRLRELLRLLRRDLTKKRTRARLQLVL